MLSLLLVPFFLPKMHERYFYPADVLSVAYAFFFPEQFFIPIGMILISLFAYQPFLFGRIVVPVEILAVGILVLLMFVTRNAVGGLYREAV
jgi:Gpi18-like mannosyltransferase